jgi:hypothetical protein
MVLIFKIRTITPPHNLNSKNIFLFWIRMMAAISDFKLSRKPAVLAAKTHKHVVYFLDSEITNSSL